MKALLYALTSVVSIGIVAEAQRINIPNVSKVPVLDGVRSEWEWFKARSPGPR